MTDRLTGIDILAALNSAVNQAGESTTRECKYVQEVASGELEAHCIAGTVLADLGTPLYILQAYEDVNVEAIKDRNSWSGSRGEGPALPFHIDNAGWDILFEAQSEQDSGKDWGKALDAAKAKARELGILND